MIMEHAQTVCTRLFAEKEPGNEATGVVCIHVELGQRFEYSNIR